MFCSLFFWLPRTLEQESVSINLDDTINEVVLLQISIWRCCMTVTGRHFGFFSASLEESKIQQKVLPDITELLLTSAWDMVYFHTHLYFVSLEITPFLSYSNPDLSSWFFLFSGGHLIMTWPDSWLITDRITVLTSCSGRCTCNISVGSCRSPRMSVPWWVSPDKDVCYDPD